MRVHTTILCFGSLALAFPRSYHQPHWETLPSIPSVRGEHTTVAIGNTLYILTGVIPNPSTDPTTDIVQKYSIGTRKWTTLAPVPIPLNHANIAAVDGKIYVLGGLAPDVTGVWAAVPDAFVYTPKTNIWKRLAPLPLSQARGSAAVGVYGSKIYLAGGMRVLTPTENGLHDTVTTSTVYDTITKKWEVLPDLPGKRDHAGVGIVDGILYVLGGRFNGQMNVQDTVFALDLRRSKGRWRSLARMPTRRGGVASGVVDGKIYIFGGEGNPNAATGVFNETEVFDPKRNQWQKLSPMRLPRHGTSGVGIAGKIYIPGGGVTMGGSQLVKDPIVADFDAFVPC